MKARTPHALKAGDWRSAREGGDAQRLLGMRSVVLLHAAHAPVGAVQCGERADHGADAGTLPKCASRWNRGLSNRERDAKGKNYGFSTGVVRCASTQ